MGLLWWWKGKNSQPEAKSSTEKSNNGGGTISKPLAEVPGMNGAVEVSRRPPNASISVFEFGVVASNDKVTLAGYCPVSEDLEPCRWEILPAVESNAPQFRVVF